MTGRIGATHRCPYADCHTVPNLAQMSLVIVRHSSPETVTERPGPEPPQKLTAFSESSLIWTSPIRTAMITASSWL
jgi:hypothetical protein